MSKNPWFDKWAEKAKKEGYPARSVYKLMEIQEKYRLIKRGDLVLDLGAAPGSWSKYLSKLVGAEGKVVGVDVQEVKIRLPNFYFLQKNVFDLSARDFEEIGVMQFDVIVSDMAPNTTGDKFVDHVRSLDLAKIAFAMCEKFLKPGGHFVVKVFEGVKLQDFRKQIEKNFKSVKLFKPKVSRKESKEIFIVAHSFIKPNRSGF